MVNKGTFKIHLNFYFNLYENVDNCWFSWHVADKYNIGTLYTATIVFYLQVDI